MTARVFVVVLALVTTLGASAAAAFDPERTFAKGGVVVSLDAGGGAQNDLENHRRQTGIELWWIQGRVSLLPLGTTGKDSFLYGALEVGLEPIYQRYAGHVDAYFAGLGAAARYHVLSLGPLVPYVELGAAPGGTNLRSIEIDSSFAFRLYGGVGFSLFVTDTVALYGGYRMVHVSNGNTSRPNRGFEADAGVAGISFFLP